MELNWQDVRKTALVFMAAFLFNFCSFGQEKVEIERTSTKKEIQSTKISIVKDNENTTINGVKGENSNLISHDLPLDFPKYNDTGNPVADSDDYKQRKLTWIKNNPERYNEIILGTQKKDGIEAPSEPLIPTKITK